MFLPSSKFKVEPGLSSFAGAPADAGASLAPLVAFAEAHVPEDQWKSTPVRLADPFSPACSTAAPSLHRAQQPRSDCSMRTNCSDQTVGPRGRSFLLGPRVFGCSLASRHLSASLSPAPSPREG